EPRRDGEEPGAEGAVAIVAVQAEKRPRERLLGEVARLLPVAEEVIGETDHPCRVGAHQRLELLDGAGQGASPRPAVFVSLGTPSRHGGPSYQSLRSDTPNRLWFPSTRRFSVYFRSRMHRRTLLVCSLALLLLPPGFAPGAGISSSALAAVAVASPP